jgi:MSHA biogenesis protein MshN
MSLINQVLQDLEKRHASESELKTLNPFVRPLPVRTRTTSRFAIAALVIFALIALGVVVYHGGLWPRNDAAQIVSRPVPIPAQGPAPAQQQSEAAPVAESLPQTAAFHPVSKLSDDLSLVAPLSVPKSKPLATPIPPKQKIAAIEQPARPVVAISPAGVVDIPSEELSQRSNREKPSNTEIATPTEASTKTPALSPERVTRSGPAPIAAEDSTSAISKQMREVAPSERAEIAFRKGVTQIQEGRANAAELEFRDALKQDPTHLGALQAMLGLLVDSGRNNEAEQFLHKALDINPRQPRHAMVLARLEVERGEVTGAINTMVAALPYVQSDFDFYAFLAALLQREGRHREAVDYYRTALRGVPGNGVWMMGMGISLRASNQSAEARDAFVHALESKQLSPALQEFVERQLRELAATKKK